MARIGSCEWTEPSQGITCRDTAGEWCRPCLIAEIERLRAELARAEQYAEIGERCLDFGICRKDERFPIAHQRLQAEPTNNRSKST